MGPSGKKWEEVGTTGGAAVPNYSDDYTDVAQPWGQVAESSAMFLGQYERTVDDKGRLAIPSELRLGLGTGAVLTRSFDNCLSIYPASKWDALSRAVDDLPQVRPEVRDLARSLFSGAVPCEFDRQGRVVVPGFLRQYAGLQADAMVIGVNSRVEIWSRDAWQEKQEMFEQEGSNLAGVLS